MGKEEAKFSEEVGALADTVVDRLDRLGSLGWRKMFGGAGIYLEGKMFALIDSEARLHFKVDESNSDRYLAAGSVKHDRMPYFLVPGDVMGDDEALLEWAEASARLVRGS